MSNDLQTTRAQFSVSKTPHLPESLRRLLADPFRLEGEAGVPWIAPTVPPETAVLRAARQELEQGLQPPKPGHVQWCVRKLFALPSRNAGAEDAAFLAEAFIDACGDYPDDLWTFGTTELLKTKTFRPSPAELVAVVDPKLHERQRMLERVKLLLDNKPAKAPEGPFVPPPLAERLRTMRDSWRKIGRNDRAVKHEVELAQLEGREVEEWANAGAERRAAERAAEIPGRPPGPSDKRCAELAAARRAEAA